MWTVNRPNISRYEGLLVVIIILLHRFFQLLNTTFKQSETWFEIVTRRERGRLSVCTLQLRRENMHEAHQDVHACIFTSRLCIIRPAASPQGSLQRERLAKVHLARKPLPSARTRFPGYSSIPGHRNWQIETAA